MWLVLGKNDTLLYELFKTEFFSSFSLLVMLFQLAYTYFTTFVPCYSTKQRYFLALIISVVYQGCIKVWMNWIMSVVYKGCIKVWMNWIMSVVYQGCIKVWMNWIMSVVYKGCIKVWMNWIMSVVYKGCIKVWMNLIVGLQIQRSVALSCGVGRALFLCKHKKKVEIFT
eukprot:TRINITY_DN936_c0_g1_i3.p2 TRINITY_DN936_c0_g1~~TRINITY_DN936_c0_g1_i3.p2  ORF type:complete len:169 (-),score=5.49 TRINITY_DN936_c0_g1_i3:83-589(-)